ncbi:hypothetical protein L1887_30782 [Cichorium endivia]|nr:hypothetical protein L1887_30782 [Cichorium endivia]
MGKRRSPMLQKVTNLIKLSIFIAKMRLIYLKKSTKLSKFKPLKHHNSYGFLQEQQFSPSSTPLIRFHRRKTHGGPVYSIYLFSCFRGTRHGAMADENYMFESSIVQVEREIEEENDDNGEEDSVDERAEKFIERFYEEMKRQRRESANFRMLEY